LTLEFCVCYNLDVLFFKGYKMYKVIRARPEHAHQILHYKTITCFWDEFIEGNKLGKNYKEKLLELVINPRILHTHVVVNKSNENKIFGCITAMTNEQLSAMPDYTRYLHPKALDVFGPWLNYNLADSVIIEFIALDKNIHYSQELYQVAEDLATRKKNGRISKFCWSFINDSLLMAIKKGFMVTDCIYLKPPVELSLLYLQKQPEFGTLSNYC
jgi:hypothetical protein